MNVLVFIAGIFAFGVVIGHLTLGVKLYLKPMLAAEFDPVAKRVMLCVFHYVSVFVVLAAAVLLTVGAGFNYVYDPGFPVKFIALNYMMFAVIQIAYALTSGIKNGIFKLFQWTFFIVIAVTAWLGVK